MAFPVAVNTELSIDGVLYHIAEHPHAPGMVYGQEGRQAVVYQLIAGREQRALKVFKPRYQVPALVGLAERLAAFATLPGLRVCQRTVLAARRHRDLLRQYPDLTYAVLMPWIPGPTWMEIILDGRAITPAQSLALAHGLVEVLAAMEERGLAHCDLSGPNLLLPALADYARSGPRSAEIAAHDSEDRSPHSPIELVDVEGLYAPGLDRPEAVGGGSYGYAQRTAAPGLWGTLADRFAGAMLLAELLGWCDASVRAAAWGESYFDPAEMQQASTRAATLASSLRKRWGEDVARLFGRAWDSETLADCPTFGTWLVTLPEPARDTAGGATGGVSNAPAQTGPRSQLAMPAPPGSPPPGAIEIPALGSTPRPAVPLDRSPVQPAPERAVADLADLFDAGLAAYTRHDWLRARELLGAVVGRQPGYTRNGRRASALLAETERRSVAAKRGAGLAWFSGGFLVICLAALLVALSLPAGGPLHRLLAAPTPFSALTTSAVMQPGLASVTPFLLDTPAPVVSPTHTAPPIPTATPAFVVPPIPPSVTAVRPAPDTPLSLPTETAPPLATIPPPAIPPPVVAPSGPGGRIAFASNRSDPLESQIYLINADGSDEQPLTRPSGRFDLYPSWSPDGTQVVYMGSTPSCADIRRTAPAGDLYIVDVESRTTVRQLTAGVCARLPRWSPDGSWIAYAAGPPNQDSGYQIYRIPATGGSPERLTNLPGRASWPAWAPDGQLVFSSQGTTDNIDHLYVMNGDGSGQRQLTFDPGDQYDPAVSPDGRRIAYVAHPPGNGKTDDIYTIARDGSDRQPLITAPSQDRYPTWSPDGRWLALHANRDDTENYDIYIVPVSPDGRSAAGTIMQLTTAPLDNDEPAWYR